MYFSYPGHPAFVGLLFKTFSVRGKPFHFLSALTLAFWEGSPSIFLSGYLSALAWMRTKIAWISKRKRMHFSCLHFQTFSVQGKPLHFLFRNFFCSRKTVSSSVGFDIVFLTKISEQFMMYSSLFFGGIPKGCIFLILVILLVFVYFSKHFLFKANHFWQDVLSYSGHSGLLF